MLHEPNIIKIIKNVIEGIQHLHSKGICHRDIKPSNIYCSSDFSKIKILDFNVAMKFEPDQKMFGFTGESKYQSPELVSHKPYDESVDLWSAGIVLFNLITRGKFPLMNFKLV